MNDSKLDICFTLKNGNKFILEHFPLECVINNDQAISLVLNSHFKTFVNIFCCFWKFEPLKTFEANAKAENESAKVATHIITPSEVKRILSVRPLLHEHFP